jgi:uncharacterized protein YecT (DUF1311 family)
MKSLVLFILLFSLSEKGLSQTQAEMNKEAVNAYKKADEEMARVYRSVMNQLPTDEDKKLLLEAQRAWIKYKEAHCKALTNQLKGGSIYTLQYHDCLLGLTKERKQALSRHIMNY